MPDALPTGQKALQVNLDRSRYGTIAEIGVTGAASFAEVFRDKRFETLDGGVFEALGRLFKRWVRVALYPSRDQRTGKMLTAHTLPVGREYRYLLQHLLNGGFVCAVRASADGQIRPKPDGSAARIPEQSAP